MVNTQGESYPTNVSSPRELVAKGVIIRSILPTDNPNRLWDISVRAMRAADSRFAAIKNATHVDFKDPYKFYKVDHGGGLCVAEVNGQIVGFGGFIKHPDQNEILTCNIRRLRVDPEYQGLGIGQKIITKTEQMAIKMGYRVARLGTSNRNPAMIHLLSKNGYKTIKKKPEPEKGMGKDYIEYQFEKNLTGAVEHSLKTSL
jgi:ribosomal protein S18 acetylase RimI-like enzyme